MNDLVLRTFITNSYVQIYVDVPEDPKFGAEDACKSLENVGVLVIPQATFRYI